MKKYLFVLFFLFSKFFLAQTAKEIIDKNIELSGGRANWKLLNTVILEGKVSLGVKDVYPVKIYQARPNLTKTVITVKGKQVAVEGYDGKKGYAMNYATNKLQEFAAYVPENFDNDFIDWESKGFEAKFLGKEKIGENYCNKVLLTKNMNKTVYYFDSKTSMLLREVKADETLAYSEYKKVGNLYFPFRIESTSPKKDSDYVMLISHVEANKTLPAGTFKF